MFPIAAKIASHKTLSILLIIFTPILLSGGLFALHSYVRESNQPSKNQENTSQAENNAAIGMGTGPKNTNSTDQKKTTNANTTQKTASTGGVSSPATGQPPPAQSPASPCNFYASNNGSDSASGLETVPFKTISKLLSTLSPGQTGCLMGGTFSGTFNLNKGGSSDSQRITLMTAPGYSAATLSANYIYTTADFITLQNLIITGTANVVTMQTFGNYVTYKNLDITNNHNGQSCITVGEYEGGFAKVISGFILDHSKVHDCGRLANGNHDHGLYLASSRSATITNSWFWGNEGGWGIQLWADAHNSYIANNVLDSNYNGNIIIAGGNYSGLGPSSNNLLEKNILTYPQSRYQVESYWQGSAGTNNVVRNSCAFGSTGFGDFDTSDGGFTTSGIISSNPNYINRASHNYSLLSGSPCAGYGSSGTVGISS